MNEKKSRLNLKAVAAALKLIHKLSRGFFPAMLFSAPRRGQTVCSGCALR